MISRRKFLLGTTALATVALALDPIPSMQEVAIVTEIYRDGWVYYMAEDRIFAWAPSPEGPRWVDLPMAKVQWP